MRILIFNTNYYPNISGGAEISTQLLAETLVTMGNDVWVCTLADKNDVKDVNGVHVIYASFRNIYWSFHGTKSKIKKVIWHLVDVYNPFFVGYIENLIDDIKPEVIHTNNICGFSCCIWDVAKKKNIPIKYVTLENITNFITSDDIKFSSSLMKRYDSNDLQKMILPSIKKGA